MSRDRGNDRSRGSMERAESFNPETGEVYDGVFVYVPKKVRLGGFVMLFQAALSDMAADKRMTLSAFRVRDALIGHLDFENYILVDSKSLAEKLGMKPSNFSREIARLVEIGLLIKGPRSGNRATLRLNPSFAWKGKATKVQSAKNDFRQLSVIEGGRSIAPPVVDAPELPLD